MSGISKKINFASDNYAGVHPQVLDWLSKANQDPAPAYGGDFYTAQAELLFKNEFGAQSESFLVWNGTAANVLALQTALKPHQAVICSELAHIQQDECGAPEKFTGAKLLTVSHHNGKIPRETIEPLLRRKGDQHSVQPKVISISQATELGTLYTLDEIETLADFAHSHELYLHMDGARLSNAAANLNCTFKQMTTDCGVDLVSFGGTKNGLMGAEAVIILNPALKTDFLFIRKQGLHLSSKMRFLAAQFVAFFENNLWRASASHANLMAKQLKSELEKRCPSIQITRPVEANSVFVILPKKVSAELQKQFYFYVWNEASGECRLMCSFQTKAEEIIAFATALQSLSI